MSVPIQPSPTSQNVWTVAKDIATVFIALCNLGLAFYVLIYTRGKDSRQRQKEKIDHDESVSAREQAIKLQWFKELIVTPKMPVAHKFYDGILEIEALLNSGIITDDIRQDMNNRIKEGLITFRRSFADTIRSVDEPFANKVFNEAEELVDKITEALFSDRYNIQHPDFFEKFITDQVELTRNRLLSHLYNYSGQPSAGTSPDLIHMA